MKIILFYISNIIRYMLLFCLLKLILNKKNSWTYLQCKNYLKNLDIICLKKIDNEIFSFCEYWKIKDPSTLTNIPKNCLNKKYILPLLINNNGGNPFKVDCVLILEEKNISNMEYHNNKKQIDKDIMKCLNFFENFEEIISLDINDYDGENKKVIDLKKRIDLSSFCIDFSLNIINQLEDHIHTKPLTKITKDSKIDFNDYNDYLYNKIYNYIILNEDDDEQTQDKENVQYLESKKNIQHNDNELTINQNSIKDCVEYGLKNEQYLVCTKYE